MTITVEKKVILTLSAFSLAVAIVVGGIIWPTIRAINILNTDTLTLREYLEKKYEGIRELRPSLKKISVVQSAVADYPAHILTAGDELSFIGALEKTASTYGVEQKIANATPDAPVNAAAHSVITLNLTTTGSYSSLLKYLNALEHLPYFATIEQLSLTAGDLESDTKSDQAILTLRLVISVYVK